MKFADTREQVRACLTGDFTDRVKVLWTYLKVCGRGEGRARLAEEFHWTEDECQEAIDDLVSLGLAIRKTGRYYARDFDLEKKGEDPDAPRTPRALAEKVDEAFAAYNDAREQAGVPPVFPSASNTKKLTDLLDWLRDQNVNFGVYLAFGIERAAFLRQKGVKFVTLEVLAGDWLKAQFTEDKAPGVQSTTAAAGKKFDDVPGLREKLLSAGFPRAAGFTKADLRYIQQAATNMMIDPRGFPEPPEGFEDEVLWLKERLAA